MLVLVFSQIALLTVPVSVASRRPVRHRSLLLPVLVSGLMMGGLVVGAIISLAVFVAGDTGIGAFYPALGVGGLIWIGWTIVFYKLSRNKNPSDVITKLCRYMLRGSILELLVAVPTHIVVRNKNYCCADTMTFIGITLGISVMLISFGPAVFYLFVDRRERLYKRKKPDVKSASD